MIELLVVVAVIALLAALLLPGLQRAKEQSKRVTCMQNLHQVGVALLMFGDDNDGWINGLNAPLDTNGAATVGVAYWPDVLTNKYLGKNGVILGFNRDGGCPSKNGLTYAYGANSLMVGLGYYPMHSLREVKNAGRIFLVADCYYPWPNYGTHFEYTLDTFVAGGWDFKGRHGGEGLNFLFVDGHGEFLKNVSGAYVSFGPAWWNNPWWSIPGATQWWPASAWGTGIWGE